MENEMNEAQTAPVVKQKKSKAKVSKPKTPRRAPSGTYVRLTNVIEGKSVGQMKVRTIGEWDKIHELSFVDLPGYICETKSRTAEEKQKQKTQRLIEKAEKEAADAQHKLAALKAGVN